MRTTIDLPDPFFRQVKARAALEGMKLREVVISALNAYMVQPGRKEAGKNKPCPFPLFTGKGGPLLKRLDNALIAKLDEEDDLERFRRSSGR